MEYSLPSEVAAEVLGVFNVADLPIQVQSNVRRGKKLPTPAELSAAKKSSPKSNAGIIVNNYVTPGLLNQYYQIGNAIGNSLASQGVYETNNQWFSPSDLAAFESFTGVPSASVAVDIGGHSSNTACSDQGFGNCIEGNLDVQYMIGVSQVTPTTYYYIDEANFMYTWLTTLASSTSPPLVLSVSWGATENQLNAAYMTAVNNEAIILSAMGVTLVAASGDDGANGLQSTCGYVPLFPASSAYFTAVGATSVRRQKYHFEIICHSVPNFMPTRARNEELRKWSAKKITVILSPPVVECHLYTVLLPRQLQLLFHTGRQPK